MILVTSLWVTRSKTRLDQRHEDPERIDFYFGAIRRELGLDPEPEKNTREVDRDLVRLLNRVETVIAHLRDLRAIEEEGRVSPLDSDASSPLSSNWFLADIVGNTVCADLLDYILRDNYFSGLRKHFDPRIFRAFDVIATTNGKNRLVVNLLKRKFRMDALSELIEILRMRYSLGEKVYYHHAKVAGGAMVARGLAFLRKANDAHDSGKAEAARLWPQLWNGILIGGDEQLLNLAEEYARQVGGPEGAAALTIMDKVRSRLFYKAIYRVRPGGDVAQRMYRDYGTVNAQHSLIERVRGERVDSHEMAVYCPSETMALKASDVLVVWDTSGKPEKLSWLAHQAHSGLLEAFPKSVADEVVALEAKYPALWNMYVFVDESKMEEAYRINEKLKSILEVQNDPLLVAALDERVDYRRGKREFLETQPTVEKVLSRMRTVYEEAKRRGFPKGSKHSSLVTLSRRR